MRKRILKKLNSRRGASLTFALLLFLVCAAVGSVVLTSATATAGRASANYEYDQRYYAVTSAAELLRDTLDGQSVTFTLTKTSTVTQSTEYLRSNSNESELVPGTPGVKAETGTPTFQLVIARADGSAIANLSTGAYVSTAAAPADLLGRIAVSMISGQVGGTMFDSDDWLTPGSGATSYLSGKMTLTVGDKDELTVEIEPKLAANGVLTLTLSNANGSENYKLDVVLSPDTRSSKSSSDIFNHAGEEPIGVDSDNDGVLESVTGVMHTDYYDRLDVKTATITWRVTGVEKAV